MGEEGRKEGRGKKGKDKYKNFNRGVWGGEIPNNQETFRVHSTLAVK